MKSRKTESAARIRGQAALNEERDSIEAMAKFFERKAPREIFTEDTEWLRTQTELINLGRHEQDRRPALRLAFSYGRALQAAPQKAWAGKSENVAAAQHVFVHRATAHPRAEDGSFHDPVGPKPGLAFAR
jgi:hypothetical protein